MLILKNLSCFNFLKKGGEINIDLNKKTIFIQNTKKYKHQEGGILGLITRTNNKNIDFVNRLKDPNRKKYN